MSRNFPLPWAVYALKNFWRVVRVYQTSESVSIFLLILSLSPTQNMHHWVSHNRTVSCFGAGALPCGRAVYSRWPRQPRQTWNLSWLEPGCKQRGVENQLWWCNRQLWVMESLVIKGASVKTEKIQISSFVIFPSTSLHRAHARVARGGRTETLGIQKAYLVRHLYS